MFQNFVSLPDTEKTFILLGITAVLGYLFSLIPVIGDFLQNYKGQIALVIAGVVINYIEQQTPDAYASIVVIAIQLVMAVLAALGVVVAAKNAMKHYTATFTVK
jgi:hypothetical protein